MKFIQRIITLLSYSFLLGILLVVPASAEGISTLIVQILHNSFVSSEKFDNLQPLASEVGVELRHLNVENALPVAIQTAVSEASLLVLDTPRPSDRSMVEQRLEQIDLAEFQAQIMVGGGKPVWQHITPQYGGLLVSHYATGGVEGFYRFLALSKALHDGVTPEPQWLEVLDSLPESGFYHPKAGQIFSSFDDYHAWYESYTSNKDMVGRVAFLTHSGNISDMLTRDLDELIMRSEEAGIVPLVFWFNGKGESGLTDVFEEGQIDVLVNMTHMQNGTKRIEDFHMLNVPVIQTLRFRDGEAADWPSAISGVSARTAAVFLATPEGWGLSDPIVLSAMTDGIENLLPEQADALIVKLKNLLTLRHKPASEKKLALMFWNYPTGEKNLGASNLNIPRSIVSIQAALAGQGYEVGEPLSEEGVIAAAQRMLGALYGSISLDDLLAENMADLLPLADYNDWLRALPAKHQAELRHGGPPAQHYAIREIKGVRYFVIPRWQLGNLLLMPQMPRDALSHAHYHDTATAPDHLYMAAYLYLRQQQEMDALIHLGTHGTQEWLPGKDRGLSAFDYPWLAVDDLPVFYPYIQDNVGEAIQAKRRGRAVTISHQTPPFAPAGLYDVLRDIHHLIHEYEQLDEGMVREQVAIKIRETAIDAELHADLGWSVEQAEANFTEFLQAIHDHLHELARTAMPLGLHSFGEPAIKAYRISTIMQQLGQPFYDALGVNQEELFVAEHSELSENPAYQAVERLLVEAQDSADELPESVKAFSTRVKELDQRLRDTQENEALLRGLAGGFVTPGSGGDPIRNPEVESGRNLYAFEADKIPTRAAYEAAEKAYAQLVEAFRTENEGEWPQKIAYSLWSSEAIRHLGVTEAQVLHALGLRPVWDAGGRVTELEIISLEELGRPRSDVVLQVTGVYRDQFDHFMTLIDDALSRLGELDEANNPIAANNNRIAKALQAQGMSAEEAMAAARYRVFSNEPGAYGTGVPHLALASTEWEDEAALAKQFLSSSQYAFGSKKSPQTSAKVNLLAEQLRGTEVAIMSRSSNLHGVLSTEHPFEFLGGLSAAVRHLDGKAPQLLISDLRSQEMKTTGLARFLSNEMRARYLNPQWIEAMQKEGYAGTLEVLSMTNNLFGWQAVDSSTVRDDQWQALFDTYINDTRDLGINEWFENHNPTAQAQILERMAEAIRKDYWEATDETQRALAKRWQELEEQFEVDTGAPLTRRYIAQLAQGFGLTAALAPQDAAAIRPSTPTPSPEVSDRASNAEESPQENVQGQVLEVVESPSEEDSRRYWALALMLLLIFSGGLWQAFGVRLKQRI